MNSAIPMISAFACSVLITYASGSFFWGFWLPMCVVGLWLIQAVNGQYGWLSLMVLTTGVPYALISAFGAGFGIVLSNFQKRMTGRTRSIARPIFLPSYAKKYGLSEQEVSQLLRTGAIAHATIDGLIVLDDVAPPGY